MPNPLRFPTSVLKSVRISTPSLPAPINIPSGRLKPGDNLTFLQTAARSVFGIPEHRVFMTPIRAFWMSLLAESSPRGSTSCSSETKNDPARDFEAVTQLLDEPFDSTKSYTLTADVGRLPDASNGGSFNYTPDWFGYSVQFVVGGEEIDGSTFAGQVTGGTVLAEDLNSVDVPINQFITSTVTYTSNPADSIYDGLPIQIRLCALETPENREDDSLAGWVAFDNVTLQTGGSSPLAITAIEHSSLDQTVTLTWGSQEGQNYSVKSSRNLIDWDIDLAVSVAADPGASTTRTFPLSGLGNGTIFFRIEKN